MGAAQVIRGNSVMRLTILECSNGVPMNTAQAIAKRVA
jgi:hypothetical protein